MQEINRVVTEQTGEVGYFQDSVARADIMAIKSIMGAGAIEDGSIDIISSVNNTNKLIANMSETKAENTELDKVKGDCVSIEANKADKNYITFRFENFIIFSEEYNIYTIVSLERINIKKNLGNKEK